MTERQGANIVELLRSRLGTQYVANMDDGRREINRVVAEELNIDSDEADQQVSQLIDAGMIRYVTGDEVDPAGQPGAMHDERSDMENPRGEAYDDRRDHLRVNAIPGQGGPSATAAGHTGGAVAPPAVAAAAPVAAAGTGSAAPAPLAVVAAAGNAVPSRPGTGYWEFRGERAGVVPSSTRKGQVEPRGT